MRAHLVGGAAGARRDHDFNRLGWFPAGKCRRAHEHDRQRYHGLYRMSHALRPFAFVRIGKIGNV